jgi:tungstate transport system substrate-binding protein
MSYEKVSRDNRRFSMKGILPKIASTVLALTLLVTVLVAVPGCSPTGNQTGNQTEILKLATTTSLYDTGLWDYLETIFEERYNADLQITAVGTGNALALGKTGDADVVAVHDPAQEQAFIDGNYSLNVTVNGTSTARVTWAYNYFIIVGPESDPAGISGGNVTPEEAFQKIQQGGVANSTLVKFVSRGDNSGTHGKEKAIWKSAGYNYTADIEGNGTAQGWYFETGQGMGATLTVANQKLAYTLTDKGTFLAYQSGLDLVPLLDTGGSLLNVYSVIVCKNGVNPSMATNLTYFLRSPDIQALIAGFGVPEYGQPLFYPWNPDICGLP